ncbi:MAG: hypothetical protein GY811_27465 [Myxococcales bacterium]|nr:hypothetical protein [Myxococcales bacterium]
MNRATLHGFSSNGAKLGSTMDFDGKTTKWRLPSEKTSIDGPRSFSYQDADSQIELVLVHVDPESTPSGPWRTIEFWTANTMYGLDEGLRCVEVSSRNPHESSSGSSLVGSRLMGSQRRQGDHFSVSFPYPVPGMEAVFQIGEGAQHITTSVVERVMLRVRMTNVEVGAGRSPDWNSITDIFKV